MASPDFSQIEAMSAAQRLELIKINRDVLLASLASYDLLVSFADCFAYMGPKIDPNLYYDPYQRIPARRTSVDLNLYLQVETTNFLDLLLVVLNKPKPKPYLV